MSNSPHLQGFIAFSAEVTAFPVVELEGTGQAESYVSTVADMVGEATLAELLETYERVRSEAGDEAVPDLLRRHIFSDEKLGPVARNIIKLWYVGTWYELPREWREAFGGAESDSTFVVSASSYTEGLLWPAIGANPPGAKGPGYGTWAGPPRIKEV